MFGDFYEILVMAEHSRADYSPFIMSGMQDFQKMINYCSLAEMAYHGPLFTWCNKRNNDLTMKKLDRVLTNDHWTQSYLQSFSIFEAGGCSDHLRGRVMMSTSAENEFSHRPFKFINATVDLQEFKPMVEGYWQATTRLFLSTSSLF